MALGVQIPLAHCRTRFHAFQFSLSAMMVAAGARKPQSSPPNMPTKISRHIMVCLAILMAFSAIFDGCRVSTGRAYIRGFILCVAISKPRALSAASKHWSVSAKMYFAGNASRRRAIAFVLCHACVNESVPNAPLLRRRLARSTPISVIWISLGRRLHFIASSVAHQRVVQEISIACRVQRGVARASI